MIKLNTPCGNIAFYPKQLEEMVAQEKFSLFHTYASESNTAYLCITQEQGVKFLAAGNLMEIALKFESCDWEESPIVDNNGAFFYKLAPSIEAKDKLIKKYVNV